MFILTQTRNNIITPRNGEPLIAATQDFITCCFLISSRDVFYDRAQFAQICNYMCIPFTLPPPTIWKPVRLWTGKQVGSFFNLDIQRADASKHGECLY